MLDLLFTERLYNKIMGDPRYTRKFWSFYWRAALPYAVLAAIAVILFCVSGVQESFLVMFVPVLLLIACAVPAGHWMRHHTK